MQRLRIIILLPYITLIILTIYYNFIAESKPYYWSLIFSISVLILNTILFFYVYDKPKNK